jgi:GntR family transcriptional regulator / MocR family aminotransferase
MRLADMAIRIEGESDLAAQLYRELRRMIIDRQLRAGDKLPSSRQLAQQLRISRSTVLDAYDRLASEDLILPRHGSGTYVAAAPPCSALPRPASGRSFRLSPWTENLPVAPGIIEPSAAAIDFRPGLPDLRSFPVEAWRRAAARKLRIFRRDIGGYGDPAGDRRLREELAIHLASARGVRAQAEDIIVTNGAQQAFDLLARILVRPGLCAAVEDPCYPGAALALRAAGATLAPVPVDRDGLVVERLPAAAEIIYVTPSHQFPLGHAMSRDRRMALVAWANERGALIIEDDYDSEHRYGARPLEALQGLDEADCVAYVGTFSKTLLPSFRLGYLVAPAALRPPLLAAKWLSDRHVPSLMQMVLAEFMSDGSFARYLRRMQQTYAERHATLFAGLERMNADRLLPIPSFAGLHLAALLNDRKEEAALVARAAARGVGVYPLSRYGIQSPSAGLFLGFGNLPVPRIREGLERMAALVDHSNESRAAKSRDRAPRAPLP